MSRVEKPHRIKIHYQGMSLGLRRDELQAAPAAVTSAIERKLNGEPASRLAVVTDTVVDVFSALPRAVKALGRTPDFRVKRSTGDIVERPDTYNSGSEKSQAQDKKDREDGGVPGRVARSAALSSEPVEVFDLKDLGDDDSGDDEPENTNDATSLSDSLSSIERATPAEEMSIIFPGYVAGDGRVERMADVVVDSWRDTLEDDLFSAPAEVVSLDEIREHALGKTSDENDSWDYAATAEDLRND